jgi:hypothetical protein
MGMGRAAKETEDVGSAVSAADRQPYRQAAGAITEVVNWNRLPPLAHKPPELPLFH